MARERMPVAERTRHPSRRRPPIARVDVRDEHRVLSIQSMAMNTNVAKCLLVSKVLVADGMMSDAEKEFLANMMTKLGLTDDERRRVIDLEGWDEAERIVNELSEDERRAIVELLVDAASADGHLSPHELATVKRVSAALKLNP